MSWFCCETCKRKAAKPMTERRSGGYWNWRFLKLANSTDAWRHGVPLFRSMLDIPIVQAILIATPTTRLRLLGTLDSVVSRRASVAPRGAHRYFPRKKLEKIGKLWSYLMRFKGRYTALALLALMLFSRVLSARQIPGSESRLELLNPSLLPRCRSGPAASTRLVW